MDFQYRENSYFNAEDDYIVETNLNKLLVTQLDFYKGNWYTKAGMQYKATSIRIVNAVEAFSSSLIEKEGVKGRVTQNFLNPHYVGVVWNQGQKHTHYYWNNINKLNKIK